MLIRENPFLRFVLPLCAGIVSGLYYSPDDIVFISAGALVVLLFISGLFFNRSLTNTVYGIALTSALFTLGSFLYRSEKENISVLGPGQALYSGILSDFPEEKPNTFSMILRLEGRMAGDTTRSVNGSILLYHSKGKDVISYRPGDRMIVRCSPVEIVNRGNPFEFDYRFYMENHGIRYFAFTDSSDIIRHVSPEHRKLIHMALIIREKIIGMYKARGLSGERLALVSAITLGQKNMLDQDQKQQFIKAGVMHIMAVSGLHAIILSLFVFRMLFFLKGKLKIFRVLITILILWIFAFVTGLTSSVLRATLMYTFLQAGYLLKRPVNAGNSVLASAYIIIIIRPSVIFDAGFLLSYSAVIFIIMFYRDLYTKMRFTSHVTDFAWQSAAVTVIAQLGTFPFTVMLFNRFPTWFILSNIIIVPVSSLVIITASLVSLTFPLRLISWYIARALDFLTGFTQLLTEKVSSLPFSSIENIGMITAECILLMITIFLFTSLLLKRRSVPPLLAMISLLFLIIAGTAKSIKTKTTGELIVYNTAGSTTVGIRSGYMLNIYSDSISSQEVSRHKAVLGLKERMLLLDRNPKLIMAGGRKILITEILTTKMLTELYPDYIILRGKKPLIDKDAGYTVRSCKLIISTGVSSGFRMPYGLLRSDNVFNVRKDGAFYSRL
ncbi:MAG: DUF4131 domain-containing protein [Bacteroidales bacterium]|nr:DUF4131 domain-containing protein [Bacteroidales bacterium]